MLIEQAREQMVEQQVRAWDVLDERVLDILRRVPRERFVPPPHRFLAFADLDIPLPHGQHMLRPSLCGRILQALGLAGTERTLEIGAGSGFLSACLGACSAQVRALEIFPDLADLARANLGSLGVRNVDVVTVDAFQAEFSERYDAIAVTGSLPVHDERFQRLLTVGGRLFIVTGEAPVMEARLVRRVSEDAWISESLFETVIDPLLNARRPEEFKF